jgi:hypothetical protein
MPLPVPPAVVPGPRARVLSGLQRTQGLQAPGMRCTRHGFTCMNGAWTPRAIGTAPQYCSPPGAACSRVKDARSSPSLADASWMFLGIRAGPLILLLQVLRRSAPGGPNSMAEMYEGTIQAQSMTKIRSPSGPIGLVRKIPSLPSRIWVASLSPALPGNASTTSLCGPPALPGSPLPRLKTYPKTMVRNLLNRMRREFFGIGFKDGFPL